MELVIGSHVGYNSKEGLLGSVNEALSYKANTFMFYTGAPQNTMRYEINDELRQRPSLQAKCVMVELNETSKNKAIWEEE